MTPDAAGALLAMAYATTRDQATEHAREALNRGATPDELAQAWIEWEQLQQETVQTIGATVPRCGCAHSAWRHEAERYRCRSRACGCTEYRPAVTA